MDNFIISIYQMFIEGNYSFPDVYSQNIITGDNRIVLVDNGIAKGRDNLLTNPISEMEKFFSNRISSVLRDNLNINKIIDSDLINTSNEFNKFSCLRDINFEYCEKAALKIIASIERCLNKFDDFDMNLFLNSLKFRMACSFGEKFVDNTVNTFIKGL